MNTEPEVPSPEAAASEVKPEPKVKKSKTKTEKAAKKPKVVLGEREIDTGDEKALDNIMLPENEDDPHWDPKMKNPVPDGLIHGLAQFGWRKSSQGEAIETPEGKLKVITGKTRWRAVTQANKLRKKAGLPPIIAYLQVVAEDPADDNAIIDNMRANVRLNRHVQEIDPMTLAESIVRALSAGVSEKEVADDHAISVNDLHGYLLLTDEDKCPPKVQELLREGKISFGAALELARQSEKMTRGEMTQAAEQIAKVAAGGVKVTAAQVKKAAGATDESPATQKEKKQLILNIQSMKLAGKHGPPVQWAAILAMEVGLGTRTVDSFITAIDKVAKGQLPRIDFKQYQIDGDKTPVKGQEK